MARALAEFGPALVESEPTGGPTHPTPCSGVSLAVASDMILGLMEGTWSEPPLLSPGWELSAEVEADSPPVVAALTSALEVVASPSGEEPTGIRGAVWYDRRHSWLAPFWARYHGGLQAMVVTWRTPGTTVAELERHGLDDLHALALWETQLVSTLGSSRGLPMLGVDVDAALVDPEAWSGQASEFLGARGWRVDEPGRRRAVALLASASTPGSEAAPGTAPGRSTSGSGPVESEERSAALRLAASLRAASGIHDPWLPPDDLRVGRWPAALLAALWAARRSATAERRAWVAADTALRDAESAASAFDWTVDRLTEAWAATKADG